jgi:hypothetical protein
MSVFVDNCGRIGAALGFQNPTRNRLTLPK